MSGAFLGFVDDAGQFALDDRAAFKAYLQKLKGHEVVVSVRKRPRRQGTQAMRYYRGVVVPDIAEACGYSDPDDYPQVHEALAWKFLRIADHPQLGYPRRRSTAKDELAADEMSAYIDQCIQWAETTIPGCRVRRPEEADLDSVYAKDYDSEAA
jgi:hypothetical protein